MASLQQTYSGDLSTSIASSIWNTMGDAADDAHEERNRVEAEIIAHNLKTPDRPFDPKFRKTYNVLGHEIRGGDFFGSALKHRFTPNPLGLLGERFHKKPFEDVAPQPHIKGQSTPFASSIDPKPSSSATMARLEKRPFPNVALPPLKSQSTPNVANPVTQAVKKPSLGKTNDRSKPVVVKDEKLGMFFAAVALSLNSSLNSINKNLSDVDEGVIVAKDGIAGTHKKLEHESDTIVSKLDQIIAALREQVSMVKETEDRAEAKEAEDKLEKRIKGPLPNSIVGLDDDPWKVEQKNEAEEQQLSIPGVEEENPLSFKDGGSFIAKGPAGGYTLPMELHNEEKVTVEPLKNAATEGGKGAESGGTMPPSKFNVLQKSVQPKTEIYNLTQQTIGKQIIENKDQDPEVEKEAKNLQKAMDLVQKLTGIFSIDLFSKATSAMGPVLGSAIESARSIADPISKLFGVENTISNNIVREVGVQESTDKRKEESETYSEKKEQKNWFQKFMGFFGMGGPERGVSRPMGGSTSYNRGGASVINQKTSMAKGGPVNAFSNWYSSGYKPAEQGMRMRDLIKQDWSMRQMSGGAGKGMWNPFRWLYTMSAEKGGLLSGPTPLIREVIRRLMMRALASPKVLARLAPLLLMEAIAPPPAGQNSTVYDDKGNLLHDFSHLESLNQSKMNLNSPEASQLISNIIQRGSSEIEDNYTESFGEVDQRFIDIGTNTTNGQQLEHSPIDSMNDPGYAKFFTSAYSD